MKQPPESLSAQARECVLDLYGPAQSRNIFWRVGTHDAFPTRIRAPLLLDRGLFAHVFTLLGVPPSSRSKPRGAKYHKRCCPFWSGGPIRPSVGVLDYPVVDGKPISAALFDFGLYLFHNSERLIQKGTGPYFYLPKLENHLEARLWNDVFGFAQDELGIPRGTIRATVLIETILAAFEMDEILYELRDHSAGLNCGRWDRS